MTTLLSDQSADPRPASWAVMVNGRVAVICDSEDEAWQLAWNTRGCDIAEVVMAG